MKTWIKRIGWTVLALVVALALVVVDFLRHGGQFKTLQPAFAGTCTTIPLSASAEDIQIDRARKIAYLSYLDRRAQVQGRATTGTVMLLDLNLPDPRPRPAVASEPPDFRPHGMSLYRAGDGSQRLFAISHPLGQGHRIEIFEQTPTGAFAPVRTITDPLLVRPNAMLAVGPNQFYVANDSGATNGAERALELVFRRGLSTVAYFDGQKMRVVATGLKSASGIAMSPDGSHVYVSETSGNRIAIFSRDPVSGGLKPTEVVDIDSAPDNLNVAPDGAVWIGAHAKVLALVRHFGDPKSLAPTQILKLLPDPKASKRLTQIYLNLGEQISAGSGGAVIDGQLLIGSITERKVLQCRLP